MTPPTATPPARISPLRRFGPLVVIVAAISMVAVLASTGEDSTADTSTASAVGSSNDKLPITWNEAEKAGTLADHDWGANCDKETGRIKVPTIYAPPCQVKRAGAKGGATYRGVTADSIKVVLYEAADDDLSASLQAKSDSPEATRENRIELIKMLEDRYQMWGRTVDIVPLKGSGSDETSSRADAVKVAEEIQAFASIGGPGQESAYAEELASRGVLCVGCGLSVPDATFQKYAPHMWNNLQTPEQFLLNLGDYVAGRLLGRPAEFAGDPELQKRDRVFGVVHFEQDPPVFGVTEDIVEERGKDVGYKAAVNLTYQLVIAQLGEKARTLISRLKEAKVTTVIFLGDPVMPIYLTKAATAQNYFPEWVITGTVLTDTTTFGRLYDQKQWAHAFGISSLAARLPQDQSDAWRLYEWFYGKEPGAPKTVSVNFPSIQTLMTGISMAGPDLTPDTFRDGLFAYPPTGGGLTTPQVSYGDHGFFPAPDYLAVDDMQEIWWDADAEGLDEQGAEGTGMMRYSDGGKRYLPGEQPAADPRAFVEEGSVVGYSEPPADEAAPTYPSP